jgi:hypothetical protein
MVHSVFQFRIVEVNISVDIEEFGSGIISNGEV